ncbi:MAG: spermine synthase [Gammaproteobacteria bacterium]|nr:spermine synthase [Gammaproteobacteria bacterium]
MNTSVITTEASIARPSVNGRLLALYTGSGLTGLAYEVLWVRMVGTQFGISIFGVVITVTAFMLGLGMGSLAGRRVARRVSNPLLMFALLEGGVALCAFGFPALADWGADALARWGAGLPLSQWYSIQASVLLMILVVPAMAMGAAFPAILESAEDGAGRLGDYYGANAIGAAIGALMPLILLPVFGWALAVKMIATLGVIIAILAALHSRHPSHRGRVVLPERTGLPIPNTVLIAYGGIGCSAILLEVAWTRLFGLAMLRTEYVMAIILAVYVAGIGLGGLVSRRLPVAGSLRAFPLVAAFAMILGLWALPHLSAWVERSSFSSLGDALVVQAVLLALLTLPVTVAFGAWLPILTRSLGGDGHSGAGLYGANALGSALGALLGGFLLVPMVGTPATIIIAALFVLVLGLSLSINFASGWRWWTAIVPLLLIAWPVRQYPSVAEMLPELNKDSTDLYRFEDAVSLTHVIRRGDGNRVLLSDLQRMDAATDPSSVMVQRNQARLPLLLHRDPHSVLFLGLGTAITASGSLAYPNLEREAVELSQGAIDAAQAWFEPVNGGVVSGMRVHHDDSRRFLLTTTNRYDVIIGDLFHPDLVGRSALLSVQQFNRARTHLNDDGVFVQWLAMNQFSVDTLKVVLRTFAQVFPRNMLFVDGFRLGMAGFKNEWGGIEHVIRDTGAATDGPTGGEGGWTWLGRYWGRIHVGAGRVQDEWRPSIEFSLPRARFSGDLDLLKVMFWLEGQRPSLAFASGDLGVSPADKDAFERAYAATALAMRSSEEAMQGHDEASIRLIRFANKANPADHEVAWGLADQMYSTLTEAVRHGIARKTALAQILEVFPDHPESLRDMASIAESEGLSERAARLLARYRAMDPLGSTAGKLGGGVNTTLSHDRLTQ